MIKREIQVINLKERTDRWEYMTKTFPYLNLKRFDAIKHKTSWKGCSLSHISVIEESKNKDEDYVIVMEDDVALFDKNRFMELFDKIIFYLEDNLNKWDIFQFGTTYSEVGNNDNVHIINEELNIIEYQLGYSASFIIYNKSVYDKMIKTKDNLVTERQNVNDVVKNGFGFRQWTILPFLAYQIDGFSDIQKRNMSYKYVFLRNQSYLENKLIK